MDNKELWKEMSWGQRITYALGLISLWVLAFTALVTVLTIITEVLNG